MLKTVKILIISLLLQNTLTFYTLNNNHIHSHENLAELYQKSQNQRIRNFSMRRMAIRGGCHRHSHVFDGHVFTYCHSSSARMMVAPTDFFIKFFCYIFLLFLCY